jgi:hypothetical protein
MISCNIMHSDIIKERAVQLSFLGTSISVAIFLLVSLTKTSIIYSGAPRCAIA